VPFVYARVVYLRSRTPSYTEISVTGSMSQSRHLTHCEKRYSFGFFFLQFSAEFGLAGVNVH
jgi:hypothetical protein